LENSVTDPEETSITWNLKKCEFWIAQVVFFCHAVLKEGLKVNLKGTHIWSVCIKKLNSLLIYGVPYNIYTDY